MNNDGFITYDGMYFKVNDKYINYLFLKPQNKELIISKPDRLHRVAIRYTKK